MRPAFIVNNRNKEKYVGRAVAGALAQTYPCEIIISDFSSTDNSCAEIEKAISTCASGADHEVKFVHCPLPNAESKMISCNLHIKWLVEQTEAEWIFQCSSDDYSLPDRVKVCMAALDEMKRAGKETSGIATTMRFEDPEHPEQIAVSGYPTESGYVSGGIGIHKMAYGSTIWAYRRDFLLKVGLDVPCTLDVYLGYLASLDKGYYVIANPQHVHFMAHDLENIGFQGKMRAAELAGDKGTIHRINELNRFQLFELYYYTKVRQQALYPMAHADDQNALLNMMISQAVGWYNERANLHKNKVAPALL